MLTFILQAALYDFVNRKRETVGIPGRIRRIAEPTAQIATRGANEHAFDTRQMAFALYGMVQLAQQHESMVPFFKRLILPQ